MAAAILPPSLPLVHLQATLNGNQDDNTGMTRTMKAMVVAGTVTAVIAGTVVQMAAVKISTGTAAVTATVY
ncbi:hypothetical protein EDB84DRAFT_1466059 [Lactarius hengduanensis]|nr:hypothetical protein EDB84DRAFT_1552073 [Lactarius hengduanensis]KAH9046655.1 hypothetical protein EDB84DRAFT_1466059 [Lactarius hengduanensis]